MEIQNCSNGCIPFSKMAVKSHLEILQMTYSLTIRICEIEPKLAGGIVATCSFRIAKMVLTSKMAIILKFFKLHLLNHI